MAGTRTQARKLVAVPGGLHASATIGNIAFWSLPDEERSATAFVRAWANNGLDPDDLPAMRLPVHIFQSACASVRRVKGPIGGDRTEIRAQEIDNTAARCTYQITLVEWDQDQRVIEHTKAMRVTFDKAKSTIATDTFDKRMAALEQDIREHFTANASTIPGKAVRNAMRDALMSVGGQNLRRKGGGVYFVPATFEVSDDQGRTQQRDTREILDGLAGVLDELYGPARADFHILPCANQETEKDMVRKHFMLNVTSIAEDLTAKLTERVRQGKGRGVRPELLHNSWQQRREIEAAVRQFESLVNVERKELNEIMGDLDDALLALDDMAGAA